MGDLLTYIFHSTEKKKLLADNLEALLVMILFKIDISKKKKLYLKQFGMETPKR